MEIVTILIKQVFIMYVLMFTGYLAYRKQFISDQGTKDIGKILLNIVFPILIISNFCVERTPEKTAELLSSLVIAIICMALSIAIAFLVFHKKDRIGEFAAAFSNTGFIGIPLVQATFGAHSVFYISMMIVLIGVLQWTYGVYTITDDRSFVDLKKVAKNPAIISVLIGVILYFCNVSLPSIVDSIFSSISGLNTPLAMLSSGVYLAQSDLLTAIRKKEVYFLCLVRLIIIPLVTLVVLRVLPLGSDTVKMAILLGAACPVGSNVAIFAQQYGKDFKKGVEYVCISTLLSIISLPLVMFIANLLFGI
ncbi:MAG: AEC family transporter [Erysipelotrichaceae bacterium]|nr:AEC family transporter [Erysipelotrichaceae bacterium]